jgi:glycosyltransferase involved in cell wall biosynthesis
VFDRLTRRREGARQDSAVRSCVIVVENLPVPFDRRVWQEAQALNADGWQVSVICPRSERHPEPYENIDGIHIYRHWLPLEARGKLAFVVEYGAALFHQLRLLWKVNRRHGFQVIQGCNPPDLIFLAALPFKVFLGKKYVFDHHDICPELFSVKFGANPVLMKALERLEKLSYQVADHVVTANETFRQLTIERTGKAADLVTTVYSVPDKEMIHRLPADHSFRNGRDVVIGYLGIIGDQDGVDHLVRAMAHLKHDLGHSDVCAVVVGDGPALPSVKELAEELDVADDIVFTGYMSGDPMLSVLSSFDIGIIPDPVNVYNDRISMNKVFEYSTLGLSIVSYPLTETQRLLGDSVVVAQGEDPEALAAAIESLCEDRESRSSFAASALELSTHAFSWDQEKEKYLDVYNGLIGAQDSGRLEVVLDLNGLPDPATDSLSESSA